MKRTHFLLVMMALYCAAGIAALVLADDGGIVTATLSSPKKQKTESGVEIGMEMETELGTAFVQALEAVKRIPEMSDKTPAYTYTAVHSTGRLFIRNGPSLEHQIISFMLPGTTGVVLSVGEEWVLLEYGEVEGYVFKGYLELTEVE